ncbi:hypothetical protein BB560_000188 [Smittium megazygosporum]|uniref:HECT-type E3 ubiquitin transferase n=1 Tax=Smittium megazygosporum TaxID=133381 RepID=A0A2T9ZL43_9FUNG|nr:hypothetical protein BB560_000188 [Smittium megazygosporum]
MFSFSGTTKKPRNINLGGKNNLKPGLLAKNVHARAIAERERREHERTQRSAALKIQKALKTFSISQKNIAALRASFGENWMSFLSNKSSIGYFPENHSKVQNENILVQDSTHTTVYELCNHHIILLECIKDFSLFFNGSNADYDILYSLLLELDIFLYRLQLIYKSQQINDNSKAIQIENTTIRIFDLDSTLPADQISNLKWMANVISLFFKKILLNTKYIIKGALSDVNDNNQNYNLDNTQPKESSSVFENNLNNNKSHSKISERALISKIITSLLGFLRPGAVFSDLQIILISKLLNKGIYYEHLGRVLQFSSADSKIFSKSPLILSEIKRIQGFISELLVVPFELCETAVKNSQFFISSPILSDYKSDVFYSTQNFCFQYFSDNIIKKVPQLAYKCGSPTFPGLSSLAGNASIWKGVLSYIHQSVSKSHSDVFSDFSNSELSNNPNINENLAKEERINFEAFSVISNFSLFIVPRIIQQHHRSLRSSEVNNDYSDFAKSTHSVIYMFLDIVLFYSRSSSSFIFYTGDESRFETQSKNPASNQNTQAKKDIKTKRSPLPVFDQLCSNALVNIISSNISIDSINILSKNEQNISAKSVEYLIFLLSTWGDDLKGKIISVFTSSSFNFADILWSYILFNSRLVQQLALDTSPWELVKMSSIWDLKHDSVETSSLGKDTSLDVSWYKVWSILYLVFEIFEYELLSMSNRELLSRIKHPFKENPVKSVILGVPQVAKPESVASVWENQNQSLALLCKISRNVAVSISWLGLYSDNEEQSSHKNYQSQKSSSDSKWWDHLLITSSSLSRGLFLRDESINFTKLPNYWQLLSTNLKLENFSQRIIESKQISETLNLLDKSSNQELARLNQFGFSTKIDDTFINEVSSESDIESELSTSSDRDNKSAQSGTVLIKHKLKSKKPIDFIQKKRDFVDSLISVLLKMPFVFPINERIFVFNALVRRDLHELRLRIDSHSNFDQRVLGFGFSDFRNLDFSAFSTIRRNSLFFDAFDSLYPLLKGNAKNPTAVSGSAYYNPDIPINQTSFSGFDSPLHGHTPDQSGTNGFSEERDRYISSETQSFVVGSEDPRPSNLYLVDVTITRESSSSPDPRERDTSPLASANSSNDFRDFRQNPLDSHLGDITQPVITRYSRRRQAEPNTQYSALVNTLSPSDAFKMGFRIRFVDNYGLVESGIDGGGVFREFIQLLENASFSEISSGVNLFQITNSSKQYIYPKPFTELLTEPSHSNSNEIKKRLAYLEFVGAIFAKSLYDGRLISAPLEFSEFFLNRWLGLPYGLNEMEQFDTQIYDSLYFLKNFQPDMDTEMSNMHTSSVLEEDIPSRIVDPFYDTFGLDFTVTLKDENGKAMTFDLPYSSTSDTQVEISLYNHSYCDFESSASLSSTSSKNANRPVLFSNKLRYLNSLVSFYLNNKSVAIPQLALMKGVFEITPCSWYRLLFCSPKELNHFISNGSLNNSLIDIADWKRNTVYTGIFDQLGENHPCVKLFWDILENSLVENERRSLLKFITGSELPPQAGFSSLNPKFAIQGVPNSLSDASESPGIENGGGETSFFLNDRGLENGSSNFRQLVSQFQETSGSASNPSIGMQQNGSLSTTKETDKRNEDGNEVFYGRFPTASTCANLLKLPVYTSRSALKQKILDALVSTSGFDLS